MYVPFSLLPYTIPPFSIALMAMMMTQVIACHQLTDCTLGDGRVLSLMPYYALTLHDFIRHRRRIARLLTQESLVVTNPADDTDAAAPPTPTVTPATASGSETSTTATTATTSAVAAVPSPSPLSSTKSEGDAISCPLTYGEVRWVGHQICAALDHLQDHAIAHNSMTLYSHSTPPH